MPKSLFTIALPVRNGGKYLPECVESILAQSCGDFELAILDNASTDGTPDYLASLRDKRVRLYPSDRPLSIEDNWARIKTIPKAELMTTIGHDDLLDRNFLEVISRLIDDHPDAGLYFTHFRLLDEHGRLIRHCRPMPPRETAAEFVAMRLCHLRDSFGTGHVMRSATYDALGGIPPFPKLLYADDALFVQAIGTTYRATALEEAFSYRWHIASASTGCAMRDLFSGLEQYALLLAGLRKQDPVLAEALRRYFPTSAARLGCSWKTEESLAAYHARAEVAPSVQERIERLTSLFGDPPSAAELREFPRYKLLEHAARSKAGRALYMAWRIQDKCYRTANTILNYIASTAFAADQAGQNPLVSEAKPSHEP